LKTSKYFMSIGVVNVKNMESAFVALEGTCQSSFSPSFHSTDTLTCRRKEWIQYASWEVSQNEFAHTRSVFERALDVDPWSVPLWLTYTETELKSRNVQHSRNIFDRVLRVSAPCLAFLFFMF
jgi:hypothetical protein